MSEIQIQTILLIGSIVDGFKAVGPFQSWGEAQDWADDRGEAYAIIDLDPPEEEEEGGAV